MFQSFGLWVKGLRKHLEMNQGDFGSRCGITQSQVSKLESGAGERETSGRTLRALIRLARQNHYPLDGVLISLGLGKDAAIRTTHVVGYIGAGAEIVPFDDYPAGGGMERVAIPDWVDGEVVAVEIRGDSMHPMRDGWLLFYRRDQEGVPDECLNHLCVCKIVDGPTLIKEVHRGTDPGHYNLVSWNAPVLENQPLEWAARVSGILPR